MYKAILFAPDGDYVLDFCGNKTKDEVWEKINDMGSRWFFYPLHFVATDKTIVSTPEGLEFLERKSIEAVSKYFKKIWDAGEEEVIETINEGYPLQFLYNQDNY